MMHSQTLNARRGGGSIAFPKYPIVSRAVLFGRFSLPGWWWKCLLVALLCVVAAVATPSNMWWDLELTLLIFGLPEEFAKVFYGFGARTGLLRDIYLACALFLVLFTIVHSRVGKKSETRIYADRIEFERTGRSTRTYYWSAVLVQDGDRKHDVWLERSGPGRLQIIRFDAHEGEWRFPVRLFGHLNPSARGAPSYRNTGDLRYAFLFSLLKARPGLRVADAVYRLCEVHPVTLKRSSLRKWSYGASLWVSVATTCALALFSVAYFANASLVFLVGGLTGSVAAGILLRTLLLKFLDWFFVAADDQVARARRERLLGREAGEVPKASGYVEAKSEMRPPWELPSNTAFSQVLSLRPEVRGKKSWEDYDGRDWWALLSIFPEYASHCDWEKIPADYWPDLLDRKPHFAANCPWHKLSPTDWAWLISMRPEFLETGTAYFSWSDIQSDDWVELLTENPQFVGTYCDWSKLSGRNWGELLWAQPDFSVHCDWSKLDDEDWEGLLEEHPEFAVHRR